MKCTQADRLILFDIDCTLLWTGGAGRESTRRAMLDVFGRTGDLDAHDFGGKTDWQTLYELLSPLGINHTAIAAAMEDYTTVMGQHLVAIIDKFPVRPCPGALEVIATARRQPDLLLGIVTGNVGTAAHVKLRAAGFDPARLHTVSTLAEAVTWYQRNLQPGDTVLFMNDLPDTYSS